MEFDAFLFGSIFDMKPLDMAGKKIRTWRGEGGIPEMFTISDRVPR